MTQNIMTKTLCLLVDSFRHFDIGILICFEFSMLTSVFFLNVLTVQALLNP
jgi:hypothetical protein